METLNHEILSVLEKEKPFLAGFADLRNIDFYIRQGFDYGIILGLPYTKEAMTSNKEGAGTQYYEEYKKINKKMLHLTSMLTDFLISKGYKAWGKSGQNVVADKKIGSALPFKTVATLSGLGWIGKTAIFVTEEYGSALRLGTILTTAPFDTGEPVTKSKCPVECTVCIDLCPGKSANGLPWEQDMTLDTFFSPKACFKAARNLAKEKLGIEDTLCGICISNCPFTLKGTNF